MKKIILFASTLLLAFSVSSSFAQEDEEKKIVLVKEKLLSKNSYLIVARGYPKESSHRPVDSAKEAAVFNAQILAQERFEGFDVIVNGKAAKFTVRDGSVDVNYVLTYKNIKYYLKKK